MKDMPLPFLHHLSSRRISSSRSNRSLGSKWRRRSFNGAICAVIVFVISPIKQSFGFEPATTKVLSEAESKQAIDTIIKGINDNYDKIPAITFKVDEHSNPRSTYIYIPTKDNDNTKHKETAAPNGIIPSYRFKISKKCLMREINDTEGNLSSILVFNGNFWTTYSPSRMMASIQNFEQLPSYLYFDPRQIGFDYLRNEEQLFPGVLNSWSIKRVEERKDGEEGRLIVVHGTAEKTDHILECSSRFACLPTTYMIRYENSPSCDNHVSRYTYEYQKISDINAWFPCTVRNGHFIGKGSDSRKDDWETSHVYTINDLKCDTELSAKDFELILPVGTKVVDNIIRKKYQIGFNIHGSSLIVVAPELVGSEKRAALDSLPVNPHDFQYPLPGKLSPSPTPCPFKEPEVP